MKITEFLKLMVTPHSGISSKRVCGVSGFFVSLIVFVYCAIASKEVPEMVNILLLCCMGLLGVDSITDIWKQNASK